MVKEKNQKIIVNTVGIGLILISIPLWIRVFQLGTEDIARTMKFVIAGAIPLAIGCSILITLAIFGWREYHKTFLEWMD